MELMRLNSTLGSPTLFHPVKLIENYESLIWTERYWAAGDFELVSHDVAGTIALLPLESYVCIRESTVPMIVESHRIEKKKHSPTRIIVKGRSFETILERRASVFSLDPAAPRSNQRVWADTNKPSDVAYKTIRMVLGDTATKANLPPVSPVREADRIPQVELPLPADYSTGSSVEYDVEAGNLYSVVLKLLEANRHGIRAVRPGFSSTKNTIDLEIYNGADLRETAIFDARFDQFDNSTYLLSHQGSTNVAYVYGPNGASWRQKNTGTEPSGLARRVLLLDEMSDTTLNSDAVRQNRGLVELYKNNSIALFDGEITELSSKFNQSQASGGYGLGDIVMFNGEYGLSRPMRVTEFIRSSDSSGFKAYPTFQTIEE